MAVVQWAPEEAPTGESLEVGVIVAKWTPLTTTDTTGVAFRAPSRSLKAVQISGTPGAVAPTILIEGSLVLNGTAVWGTLHDPQGNDLSFTTADINANKIEQILEDCVDFRPRISAGGDGATSLTIRAIVQTMARR